MMPFEGYAKHVTHSFIDVQSLINEDLDITSVFWTFYYHLGTCDDE